MVKFILCLFLCCLGVSGAVFSQDTLPKISVKNRNGKIIISWANAYGANISNINIQRSSDSIKRFTTIGTVLNPMNKDNGFVDNKYFGGPAFYRVFVAFEGGKYLFSQSYRPVIDSSGKEGPYIDEDNSNGSKPANANGFVPSKFVFTGRDNNVIINLADAAKQKFTIHFFDENNKPLFILKPIRESYLILDKVNFLRSGWFKYHLYNNDILLEKFKFFIPKDGKSNGNGKELRYR